MVRTRRNEDNGECPICMDNIKFGAETNCGHLFCSDCILRVWDEHIDTTACISCPLCRQAVSLLLCCFTESEASSSGPHPVLVEREMLRERLDHYNRLHSQENYSYMNHLRELPTILRHVWAELFTWDGLHLLYREAAEQGHGNDLAQENVYTRIRISLCLVLGVIYTLWPFDLIPEAVLGVFGLLDDFFLVAVMLLQISVIFRRNASQAG